MEQIAHRVYEYQSWPTPMLGVIDAIGTKNEVEAVLERMSSNASEAFGETFSVAVVAPGANLGAAGDRIPGAVSPLYGAAVSHDSYRNGKAAEEVPTRGVQGRIYGRQKSKGLRGGPAPYDRDRTGCCR